MLSLTKRLAGKIGMDGAIAYTVLARGIQAGRSIISIYFIIHYLTKEEQGYYYTFGSILAIQIFFELGLSSIITQFVAHEKALLEWTDHFNLAGNERAISRLSSLLRFCTKWFLIISIFLIVALLIVGHFFFLKFGAVGNTVDWRIPWIILAIMTSVDFVLSPIFAFLQGLGKVKEVAQIRLVQQLSQMVFLYLFLFFGFKLYSSPVASAIGFIVPVCWLFFSSYNKILTNIWHQLGKWYVDYKLEVFPFQWKIALSWMSGYFIFQLFNPVVFAIDGPKIAGQMGMTLTAMTGISGLSMSWINTKVPLFSGLIAHKDYTSLDSLFYKTTKQALSICLLGLCSFIFFIAIFSYFNLPISKRFLPLFPVILLCIATFVNQYVGAIATYLRCHKKEPFLIVSIVMGLLTAASTLILGYFFGVNGIVIGYTSLITFVSLIWGYKIFKKKKIEWHK